uniref:Uncharacterized protein n=1 Tax=viral metagenome TaxID=1070528 RepID=A0A6C0BCQ0_9ZZZZ
MGTEYDIIIIGAGWYGCHIASLIQNDFNVLIIDKSSDIFKGSSYYNQNRLHLGYHYSRDFKTRNLCQRNYDEFKRKYNNCIEDVKDNFYCVSKESLLCQMTYLSIFKNENFDINLRENNLFQNIEGDLIDVNEKVINSKKAKEIFKERLNNCTFLFDTEIKSINHENDVVNINDLYSCKLLLDCTYNQLGIDKRKYTYELTISLLYRKLKKFGAITIVDGNFCSLYPREDKIYTLTDVENTPVFCSSSFDDIKNLNVSDSLVLDRREKMENKITKYFPDFKDFFSYDGYFLSYKTKMISSSDSRDISIFKSCDRIVSVNCGKIYGIFEWEVYILNHIKNLKDKFLL